MRAPIAVAARAERVRGEHVMVRSTLSAAVAATRPRRRWLRNTFITLGVLVALLGLAAATAYWFVSDAINQVQRVDFVDESLERPTATTVNTEEAAPVNILLLGTDAREAMEGDPDSLTGFRSDAIMVAQLSPDREHLTVMSIMRDNWVPIAGFGDAKINAAFSYGGLPLAVNTVEQFIGVRIDHVAIVDFASFEGLTEAVGGVTVHNSVSFTSHHGGTEFPQGEVSLSGDEALDFVRERYAFSDGDYQRVRNQQAFMSGLVTNLLSGDTLGDPVRIIAAFQALQPHLQTSTCTASSSSGSVRTSCAAATCTSSQAPRSAQAPQPTDSPSCSPIGMRSRMCARPFATARLINCRLNSRTNERQTVRDVIHGLQAGVRVQAVEEDVHDTEIEQHCRVGNDRQPR